MIKGSPQTSERIHVVMDMLPEFGRIAPKK